jgi:hypothetical protein
VIPAGRSAAARLRCVIVVVGVAGLVGAAAPGAAAAPASSAPPDPGAPAAILGVWQGTSLCTNLQLAPACKDEQVIYTFVPAAETAGAVRLEADKVVEGERQRMGEMELVFREASGRWESEIETARYHSLWSFEVEGRTLHGELVDLPSGGRVRAIRVERVAVP